MEYFTFGLIITVGIIVGGILYSIYTDPNSDEPLDNTFLKETLYNVKYIIQEDGFRVGGDTHYDRVDRGKKYYSSMSKIELKEKESIEITFNSSRFIGGEKSSIESRIPENLEYVTIIEKNQTFVVNCDIHKIIPDLNYPEEVEWYKWLGILKYHGITEKDNVQYYVFHHEGVLVPKEINCKFPDLIEYSLDIEFDVDIKNRAFPDEIWDFDWQ